MKALIKQCLYYKGEKECPKSIDEIGMGNIWNYEQMWVEREELRDENKLAEYIRAGLKDFNADDGTHITMKALLFNRYEHWSGGYGNTAENFREWYKGYYIGESKIKG